MTFEQNLFISYAHIDDQPLTPGQQGWITRFHGTLEALLSMRLGRQAKIWRDQKLKGNDVFSDEIVTQFSHTAVMVSILTSRYLNSEWCTREVREFCECAQEHGGLLVGNKSRVFKVIKTPVDTQELPPPMKDVLGYEFFTEQDGAPLELDASYGQEFGELYVRKVAKLAFDVAQLLKALDVEEGARERAGQHSQGRTPAPAKPVVYLAECSYDRKQAREVIEGELKRLGYTVLPDRRLPVDDEAEYVAAVGTLLDRSALSIHLVGEHYGAVPDGPSAKSAAQHQNELAVTRSRSRGLARVIWLPEGTRSGQAGQQAFIEQLHQDAEAQFGADLITGDFEQLRAAVHATLKKLEQPEPKPPEADATGDQAGVADSARLVYVLCDEKDRKATVPIRKLCKQAGLDCSLPAFAGDASQVRKANQQLLATCDGVLVFYGAGDEAWKRTIDNELKKMAGYRGGKPLLARYTFLAEPRTSDKEDVLVMDDSNVIDGLRGFEEAGLSAFLDAVRGGGAPS